MTDARKLRLRDGEAHVWYAWTAACSAPELQAYYRSLLSEEERGRLERFAFEHLKLEYLVTRALCRTVLSAYAHVPPAQWRFTANGCGRPRIAAADDGKLRLRFNLSNARSLVACVVTCEADAGIDVEEINRPGPTMAIADRYFSPAELQALHVLPSERQRFFELWTLKESYIKARGMGLSIPLEQFSFFLDEPSIRIAFDPRLNDSEAAWQFRLYHPGDAHMMAVGIRRTGQPDFRVSLRELVPDVQLTWQDVSCDF